MKLTNKKSGFTLIEMMVAVFVFSVVMVLATGAIFSIINANKTSQAIKSVMDNLSSALDSMSRNVRYGTVYHCGSDGASGPKSCPGDGSDTFTFYDKDGIYSVYKFLTDSGVDGSGHIERCVGNSTDCVRLTAPEVHIQNLNFYVSGAETWEDGQPQMLVSISGYAKAGAATSTFNIETMVDQRGRVCKDRERQALIGANCP